MSDGCLGSPLRIGAMELRNRIAFPPMNTNYCNENGAPTEQMASYYARRAKGGAALVTVEATAVDLRSKNHAAQPQLAERSVVPAWSRLVDKVHRYGAKISVELTHWGADGTVSCGQPEVSASNVTSRGPDVPIHALTLEEIKEQQRLHVNAVVNAELAGFDAVTFHAAHGNLMPQFFSSFYNKRTDWYGGSLQNRARFAVETVRMTREAVGRKLPLILRISGEEYITGGRPLAETIAICQMLEEAGIDAFEISGGIQATYLYSISPYNFPGIEGFLMDNAKAVRQAVKVPVIGVGGVRNPATAERLLKEGYADMISLGRAQIADPDFCRKALTGREAQIRPCVSCNHCLQTIDKDRFLTCTVNAQAGREADFWSTPPAGAAKKVLIAGGGPAGMEAARVAAQRGHRVTLLEASESLGGSMHAAGLPPHKESLLSLEAWYQAQLKRLGVELRLGTRYETGMEDGYDAVLLATGAVYMRVITGSEQPHVLTAVEALEQPDRVGKRVVVIGGGASACETAEYFGAGEVSLRVKETDPFTGEPICEAHREPGVNERDVTIVEMLPVLCGDMQEFARQLLLKKLELGGVRMLCNCKVSEITGNSVRVIDLARGVLEELAADTVILAGGLRPNRIGEIPYGSHYIGDADKPGKIVSAIAQGYAAAMSIDHESI